jgi:hypothetical protein
MKQLVSKCIVKTTIAIILCATISILISSLAPHLSNDIAIGQLENDDMSWSLMNAWYQIQSYSGWIYALIGLGFGASISKDCYKYFKSREENV